MATVCWPCGCIAALLLCCRAAWGGDAEAMRVARTTPLVCSTMNAIASVVTLSALMIRSPSFSRSSSSSTTTNLPAGRQSDARDTSASAAVRRRQQRRRQQRQVRPVLLQGELPAATPPAQPLTCCQVLQRVRNAVKARRRLIQPLRQLRVQRLLAGAGRNDPNSPEAGACARRAIRLRRRRPSQHAQASCRRRAAQAPPAAGMAARHSAEPPGRGQSMAAAVQGRHGALAAE